MNIRLLKLFFILLLLLPTLSCAPVTYSKEKVEQSVIDLCKKEYDLDVEAKIIGSTLGVHIPIDGLVDPDLKLNKEAGEKIEDVALSIHRVTMSTNKPLSFYTLVARDTKTLGAEFTLTGFVYDVVRVRLLDISRGEYHKRILRDFKFNPVIAGQTKINELFKALNENSPQIQNISPVFYPLFPIGKPGSQKIQISQIDSKEISQQEALFYIKTKEYYDPLPQFEAYRTIFPSGFGNEYLILVNVSMFPSPIKEIVPKYFYSENEIKQRDLKETFANYKDTGYIGINGLPKKDLALDWFLSQQIANRINMLFAEDKKLRGNFTVKKSEASVDNRVFRLNVSIVPDKPGNTDNETIFSAILKHIGNVIHRYSFEDFEGIEITNTDTTEEKVYLSKDDLEKFRLGKLKFKDITRS
ncbi:MAG: hypothetical protein KKH08_00450 [Candidatus Omnitrophica bacterium]|nr:hypothetical protein [Candidatus Omnitrophota bacterium]